MRSCLPHTATWLSPCDRKSCKAAKMGRVGVAAYAAVLMLFCTAGAVAVTACVEEEIQLDQPQQHLTSETSNVTKYSS